MLYFSEIHKQVLNTMRSNTLSQMSDEQIESYLDMLLIRAIADFRYPRVPLTFNAEEGEDGEILYVFTENVTQHEINVLLVLVKQYWLEQQLDNENRFEDVFYDRDVRTFSRANLMKTLNERYREAKEEVRVAQYNYSRVKDGKPTFGDIYE